MKNSANSDLSPPLVELGTILFPGDRIKTPSLALWQRLGYYKRTRRGAMIFRMRFVTSAWINEALSADFDIRYLRYRAYSSEENSVFIQSFRKLDGTQVLSKLSPQAFYGLDVEPGCTFQQLHFEVLTKLWRYHASVAKLAIQSR